MNSDFQFSWKFKNFGIHTVYEGEAEKNKKLRKQAPIELVKYFDGRHASHYVVAMFELDDEGYELHFVGDRPLKDISADEMKSIWPQLQAAQKMLNAYFDACEDSDHEY